MLTRIAPFASAALAWIRAPGERSRRMELALSRLTDQLARMERTMADNESALLTRLDKLQQEVSAWTTQKGQELAEAKKALATAMEAGRAAQKQEDEEKAEADKQAALAKIEEISSGLIQFTPSGN